MKNRWIWKAVGQSYNLIKWIYIRKMNSKSRRPPKKMKCIPHLRSVSEMVWEPRIWKKTQLINSVITRLRKSFAKTILLKKKRKWKQKRMIGKVVPFNSICLLKNPLEICLKLELWPFPPQDQNTKELIVTLLLFLTPKTIPAQLIKDFLLSILSLIKGWLTNSRKRMWPLPSNIRKTYHRPKKTKKNISTNWEDDFIKVLMLVSATFHLKNKAARRITFIKMPTKLTCRISWSWGRRIRFLVLSKSKLIRWYTKRLLLSYCREDSLTCLHRLNLLKIVKHHLIRTRQ